MTVSDDLLFFASKTLLDNSRVLGLQVKLFAYAPRTWYNQYI